jgi:hypothetical protein
MGLSSAPQKVTAVRERPRSSRRPAQRFPLGEVRCEHGHLHAVEAGSLEFFHHGPPCRPSISVVHSSRFISIFIRRETGDVRHETETGDRRVRVPVFMSHV